MRYRREIDGLRAVAVLPVIMFHAGMKLFSGGYVGVDVFFVISGYLITLIILKEVRGGTFSLLTFYDRRARRIIPALSFVAICTLPFALLWMIPSQQQEFSRSLVSVFIFLSNFFFWRGSNYFAGEAEVLPMLHTWSLAVEEQYYILFPLALIILSKYKHSITLIFIVIVTVISFSLAEYASRNHPGANFYLTPTRAWELLVGSICAYIELKGLRARSDLLAALGLALILGSVFLFDRHTPFPSAYALAPVIGTALIILYGEAGTLTARLLSTRLLVGIGLISYSAYLWHQPLFAFARIRTLSEPPPVLMIGLALITFLLATFSWRYVERPFRKRSKAPGARARTLLMAGCVSVLLISVGLSGSTGDGLFLGAFSDRQLAGYLNYQSQPNEGLSHDCGSDRFESKECRTGQAPEIAVWGDSFAMHLVEGIVASKPDARVIQMTMPRCGPFLDAAPYTARLGRPWSESCLQFNADVFQWLESNSSVKYVVLSSPFRAYISDDWTILHKNKITPSSIRLAVEVFTDTLKRIEALGKKVVVFSPTPQSGENIGRCLATRTWLQKNTNACDFLTDDLVDISIKANRFLEIISKDFHVVWLANGMCENGRCKALSEGNFIYFDRAHLTVEGSRYLGKKMRFYDSIVESADSRKE